MVAIRRAFTVDPGVAVLGNVGSVNIIDEAPPSLPRSAGTGVLCLVGEFEKGPFETPTEVFGSQDRFTRFGGLGWTVDGQLSAGPCAQRSGGTEAWNGNGFIWLTNKPVNRLVLVRADTSAGTVQMRRLACLTGEAGPYSSSNGAQATWQIDDGPTTVTVQTDGTPGQIVGSGVVYPLPLGTLAGKTVILAWDDLADTQAFTVTLQGSDITLADAIARINARTAATIAYDDGGQLGLQSVREGYGGRIKILGGSALADLGLPTAVVPDVWTTTVTADTVAVQLRVSRLINGQVVDFDTVSVPATPANVTAKRDALLSALNDLAIPGATFASSGANAIIQTADPNVIFTVTALAGGGELTIVNTTPGVALEVFGTGNVFDLSSISTAEAVALIDAAANVSASVIEGGLPRVCNTATPGTGKLQGIGGDFLAAMGFDTTTIADAANAANVVIPAGTLVQDATATATIWITMEDTETGTEGGPWDLKVRPFYDTDTAVASSPGDVTDILSELPDGFAVINDAAITRLTAAQIDGRYIDAIRNTLAMAQPANEINVICSARSSQAINLELRQNCIDATASGYAGRRAVVRPLLGASRATARALRATMNAERVQIAFPGLQVAVKEIRDVGVAGGIGFADDGVVDVGSDSFLATLRTVILPEQSAGIDPAQTNYGPIQALALESAYDPGTTGSTKLTGADYISFKANGITAPAQDRESGIGFVDDVTSVSPTLEPGRTAAFRRALADFINDTLLGIGQRYKGKIITTDLRRQHLAAVTNFLGGLLAKGTPDLSRIRDYSATDITTDANPEILRTKVVVVPYANADAIVYSTTVSTTATVTQEAA